ncbi:hypothetical protein GWI33_019070 [Rhynchophorus ferrugineus]|uniref:Uncharacterized protein n=1 Tax=Rhynchophorus ferrugineus TaxID=354439 RepID=A0A834I637_RHYFE|nr:hypothetical protein GWI33_019070 [Rhynchophorus ferrugineus]
MTEVAHPSPSKSTDWTVLFPLKTGIFRSTDRLKKKMVKSAVEETRLKMRRGSSMSDIDKLAQQNGLSDLVRSSTTTQKLSVSPASVPHSPYMSRSFLSSTTTVSVRGSIGDLMNQKKYGSSQWSVRSETLVAKTVPLSTVTPRQSPPPVEDYPFAPEITFNDEESIDGPLTAAQRTQRLSRLLKQRKAYLLNKAKYYSQYQWVCFSSSYSLYTYHSFITL